MSHRTAVACLVLGLLVPAAGADAPLELPRLSGPVTLDGVPGEEAWSGVGTLPLTVYAPVYRAHPRQRSEIRAAHDDHALYLAGHFYDDEPGGLRVNSLYRDRWNGDDAFAIYVDAFNDNRNAKWFGVTPAGMRFDSLVSDDGATLNGSWDAFWDARATVSPEGWFAEVRIPFSTLGFKTVDGLAVMGLTVSRLVSRSGERVTFPDIDPKFEFRAPSQARDVALRGVRTRRPLYLTPYVLGGRQQAPDREDATSGELGLDLKYALSGTLRLDVTANTDFAQAEADNQQIALDRFPLFFPEKRRFFQEDSGLFDFATTGGGQLFHSRRIGLTDDRRPVPVLGGARVVGRVGGWDVGALDMQTEPEWGLPGENFGVLRLRRPVLNPYSHVGGMVTTRVGGDTRNVAGGMDTHLRLFGDEYLTLKWAASADERDPSGPGRLRQALLDAYWQRRTNRGLSYNFRLNRTGRDFRPETGFLPRSGTTTFNAASNWYFFTDEHRVLRRYYPGAIAFQTWRHEDGALESGQWATWVQWDTKAGGGGWLEPKVFRENVVSPFRIGSTVQIPAGVYTFADVQLVLSMADGRRLRTDLDLRTGTFFDGTRTQLILTPTWNASRHLELGGSYQLTRLRFADRGQEEDIQLASLQVRAALDARASANALLQWSSVGDRLDLSLRLRYNFAEGTDLWLVYDEGVLTDGRQGPGGVERPLSAGRAVLLKYSHTFGL
jgi:hypothetical protein